MTVICKYMYFFDFIGWLLPRMRKIFPVSYYAHTVRSYNPMFPTSLLVFGFKRLFPTSFFFSFKLRLFPSSFLACRLLTVLSNSRLIFPSSNSPTSFRLSNFSNFTFNDTHTPWFFHFIMISFPTLSTGFSFQRPGFGFQNPNPELGGKALLRILN